MYYLFYIPLYLLSLLPFFLLYGISDFAYLIIYHVFKYRRAIVSQHLLQAFPNKNAYELKTIEQKFYKAFCDQWIETIKLLSASGAYIAARSTGSFAMPNEALADGKPAFVLMAHQFNWEYACISAGYTSATQMSGLYLPIKSPVFDRLILHMRRRTGNRLLSAAAGIKSHIEAISEDACLVGVIADQVPGGESGVRWYDFLGKPAPFGLSPEKLAKRCNGAVYFGAITKSSRGKYCIGFTKICDDASTLPLGEITASYVALLEKSIQQQPENWMWSHRRWKRELKEGTTIFPKNSLL